MNIRLVAVRTTVGLASAVVVGVAVLFFLALGGGVFFIRDDFHDVRPLSAVTRIHLSNGLVQGFPRDSDIKDRIRIARIRSVLDAYHANWFDATYYPAFATPYNLTLYAEPPGDVQRFSFGLGGMSMLLRLSNGHTLELYNAYGTSPKFHSLPATAAGFSSLCKAIGDEFYEHACAAEVSGRS